MVKIVNVNTNEEFVFNNNPDAAKFLGITYGSLYYKYTHQSKNDGYLITEFEYRNKHFKKYKEENFNVEFLDKTAILTWIENVDSDYDEEYSNRATKQAISDTLRNQMVFHTNFIIIGDIYPKKYTKQLPQKVTWELYVHFKDEITTKDKKRYVKELVNNLWDKLHQ